MSSYHAHPHDRTPLLKLEAMSSQSHQSTATPEGADDMRYQDQASSENSDDGFDGGEEFRDRVNAIKDGADSRYNPMNESLPRLPAYHPSFMKAERYCSELMEGAALVLKNAEYKDTRILQLLEKASKSKSLEYPKPRVVGLIGDSGVGKSSLINCLLDTPDIALSGANGEACTNVITEYHQAQPAQTAPFMAEIILFEPSFVQHTLATHLGWYYRYIHRSVESMDQETTNELNARVDTATETFQALFADREEFCDEERTKEFLGQAQSPSDPKVLQTLFAWVQECISKCGAEGGVIRRSACAPEELGDEIEPFIKLCKHLRDDNDCHVPSLWPLIQRVNQDVPAKQRPLDLDATPEATEEHERLLAAYDHVCRERKRLAIERQQAKGKAKQGFTHKIMDLELNKKIYSALLREGLILMRNQKVTTIMRQKYRSLTQDKAQLIVFAVSNSDYIKHKDGYDLSEEIPVSVSTTGIPHVRYQLSKLPARTRLDALKHYCHGTVEDLVGSLHNWSQQSTIRRRVELQDLVAKPGTAVEAEIAKYVAELKSVLESCILQECEIRQGAWVKNSVQLFKKWTEEWHPTTFAAWCRNDGAHKTKTKPFVSWNAEILGLVTKDMTTAWQVFDERVVAAKEGCFTALVGLVDGIGEDLAAEEGISMEPMAPFLSSLASKKELLGKWLDSFSAKVDGISRDTKLNITMDDEDPDGYLLQAMSPLYEKCANVTGKNMHTQRSTLLNDAMSKGEPFAAFGAEIKKSIERQIDIQQPRLLIGVQRVFNMILEDFSSTFTVEEIPDPKRDLLRSQIQQFVDDAQALINGPLATELATAMADSE